MRNENSTLSSFLSSICFPRAYLL